MMPAHVEHRSNDPLTGVMLVVLRVASVCLLVGVVLWMLDHEGRLAARLLTAGLVGLLAMPLLKLVTVVLAAARGRDWVTLAATLTVMVILIALTIRDAIGLRS